MAEKAVVVDKAKSGDNGNATGPGAGPMSPLWIGVVALYLVVISLMVLYGLLKVWPYPTPSGEPKNELSAPAADPSATTASPTSALATAAASPAAPSGASSAAGTATTPGAASGPPASTTPATTAPQTIPARTETREPAAAPGKELPDPELISFFGGFIKATISLETRLLLLVMLAGALGSLMHSLRSLYWYTGNREMVWSWVAFYLLLPLTGAMLAVIFYLVVRGGFFSPQASTETTSPFGFAALSALVGLFSPQATLKLKEVAETIFTKPGAGTDHKPQESEDEDSATPAPIISTVTPSSGKPTEKVTITGAGFLNGAQVKFGGIGGTVTSTSSTAIEVIVPTSSAGPATVDVEITNPNGTSVTLNQAYTYLANGRIAITGEGATVEKPVTGEGGDDELIDGCDVDLQADTADEELPITEGGVK